jgi:hypothetical protein
MEASTRRVLQLVEDVAVAWRLVLVLKCTSPRLRFSTCLVLILLVLKLALDQKFCTIP